MGLRRISAHRIMCHSFHLFPYKIQTLQTLNAAASNARETFANAMLQQPDAGEIDVENIWFSDEAHFSLKDFVNKHNWRIGGTENPDVAVASHRHSHKDMVLSSVSSKSLIKPFFRRQTITAALYLDIVHAFLEVQNELKPRGNSGDTCIGTLPQLTTEVPFPL